ncbi:hypothetical protein QBC34DRAFT_356278 [Podospora aff. communis PSN243]|uniref:Nephrocystin 3-like N-terminal domain-containing protein n=1 Tax=Podospora aff. communis PSN243 TaxID=3040156 RepID=A0AAV9GH63_9PEZI|nr:hypothetical protein QBC34DRAFT_356278 [Podospora aff. communis PSN243]
MLPLTVQSSPTSPANSASLTAHSSERPYQNLAGALRAVQSIDANLEHNYCCWQDVIDAIEMAKARDQAKADKSFMRARLRTSGAELGVLESLTNMIPDQNGLSVLRGGIMTVLKAGPMVHIRLEIRETILRTFEDIPEIFIKAAQAWTRFPDDPDLLDSVERLYETLLVQVDTLIRTLTRSYPCDGRVSQLWRQLPGKEAEVVRGCLDQISRAVSRVGQCSTAALERTVAATSRKLDESLLQGHAIVATISEVSTDVRTFNSNLSDAAQKVIESNHKTYSAFREELSTAFLDLKRQIAEVQTWQSSQIAFTENQTGLLPWQQAPVTPPRLLMAVPSGLGTPAAPSRGSSPQVLFVPFLPPPMPQRSVDDILNSLRIPDGATTEVLNKVEFKACRLHPDAVGRGEYLMEVERFHVWLGTASSASDLVLIDGYCSDATVESVSPLTALCASLIRNLRSRSSITTLHHFCGQHIGTRDPLHGPGGLIRHLVHQLLSQVLHHPLHNNQISPDMDLEDQDISSLCRLAEHLMLHLDPSRPIFCIIDSVCVLETALDGWRNDTRTIVETLLRLVDDTARLGPGLKVLLTCTERSIDLADWVIPSDRHLSLVAARSLYVPPQPLLFQQVVEESLMLDDLVPDEHNDSWYSSESPRDY